MFMFRNLPLTSIFSIILSSNGRIQAVVGSYQNIGNSSCRCNSPNECCRQSDQECYECHTESDFHKALTLVLGIVVPSLVVLIPFAILICCCIHNCVTASRRPVVTSRNMNFTQRGIEVNVGSQNARDQDPNDPTPVSNAFYVSEPELVELPQERPPPYNSLWYKFTTLV